MNEGLIPRRYAKALLKLANERGCSQRLYVLMGNLVQAYASMSSLQKTIANPFLPIAEKKQLLVTAAKATEDDALFADFIRLLEENKRMPLLRDCANAYISLYRKDNRIYRVEVAAAATFDKDQEYRLKKLIEDHLDGGTIEYSMSVDPSLIGGFVVTIDNERLDASVANELEQLRRQLLGK